MSSFFIRMTACRTLSARAGFGSLSIVGKTVGTICHGSPYLSFSQPHCPASPPSDSCSHIRSSSSCVSQCTMNDTASVNVKCGPPLSARNSCPSSWNRTVSTLPLGRGLPSSSCVSAPIVAFVKMEVEKRAASSAWSLNHRHGVICCIVASPYMMAVGAHQILHGPSPGCTQHPVEHCRGRSCQPVKAAQTRRAGSLCDLCSPGCYDCGACQLCGIGCSILTRLPSVSVN